MGTRAVRRRLILLGGTTLGALAVVGPPAVRAADFDLNGVNRDLTITPVPGSFGGLGFLNGADNLTNNGGANATLTQGGAPVGTIYSGIISDGATNTTAIVHTGGELIITGANTYSGGTTLQGGTIALDGATATLGTGTISVAGNSRLGDLAGGGVTVNNDIAINAGVTLTTQVGIGAPGGLSLFGTISGGGALNVTRFPGGLVGILAIFGPNTYSGGTTFNDTIIGINDSAAFGTGTITVNGISSFGSGAAVPLDIANDIVLNAGSRLVIANSGAATENTASGNISGAGSFAKGFETATLILTGNNTYSGSTLIAEGTLRAGSATGFSAASAFTVETGGTLDIGGFSSTIGSLAGDAGSFITNSGGAAASLTTGGNGSSTTYAGIIQNGASALSLTKTGAGTLILSGTNTYSGGTTLQGGTIALDGATATLGTGTISVTGNSRLGDLAGGVTVNNDIAINAGITLTTQVGITAPGGLTLLGTISGGGALNVTRFPGGLVGILGIIGPNTYSGGTTFNSTIIGINDSAAFGTGTITVNGISSFGSGAAVPLDIANDIVLNAGSRLVIANSGAAAENTASGDISGAGSFAKGFETATLILTGNNTYSGTTLVAEGTLRAGSATGFSAASSFMVEIGGTLDIGGFNPTVGSLAGDAGSFVTNSGGAAASLTAGGNGGSTSYAGVIQDGVSPLSLTKAGAGTLILTGTNTYSGGTTIDGGRLSVGADANLGNAAGAIAFDNGAMLETTASFASARAATLGAGGGTLSPAAGTQLMLSGVISGAGPLAKEGAGAVSLSGISSYTGATIVNAGRLAVNGSIAASSLTTVNAGAELGGNGTVGPLEIKGGTLAPGNSVGLLTVLGNLSLTPGSIYLVEVTPANADRVNVTGTATLGNATVAANFAPGSYVQKRYTILNATGGVNGVFSGPVNTNLPDSFKSLLSYDAINAYLGLQLAFLSPGLNVNQQNVADGLVNGFNLNGGIPLALGSLDPAGLTQASGELATAAQQASFRTMDLFVGLLTSAFTGERGGAPAFTPAANAYAPESPDASGDGLAAAGSASALPDSLERRWSVWAAGFGGSARAGGDAVIGSHDTGTEIFGVAFGADRRLSADTLLGFAVAGSGTRFGLAGNLGSGSSRVFQAGVFAHHEIGNAYFAGALAYGFHDITTSRLANDGAPLTADFGAHALTARLEGGYRYELSSVGITPYAAAQVDALFLPGYSERGAGVFPLNYGANDVTTTRSELGFHLDRAFDAGDAIITLRAGVAWVHNFNPERSIAAAFQSLPGSAFTVFGANAARDAGLISASAEAKWMSGLSAALTFEGEFSGAVASVAGKGVLRYRW